jgi:type II secretory pathway pseudopilin PulG
VSGSVESPAGGKNTMKSQRGFAVIDLLFVCAIIGILAGMALPRLMTARNSAQAASAVASMRTIGTGQLTFAITCGHGFYAPSLTSLATAPAGSARGFIDNDLGSADVITKSGYTIQIAGTPFAGAPDPCNALGAGKTTEGFAAIADPLDAANTRFFGTNASGAIWEDVATFNGTMPEAGEPPNGWPLR